MTIFSKRILPLCLAIGLVAQPALAGSLKSLKTEAQFREAVVDRKLTQGSDIWFRVKSDGTIEGKVKKDKFRGTWQWSGKYYCRNGIMGSNEIGSDCQVVKAGDGQVQFWGKKGKDKPKGTYAIQ